jgi:hypothetical protein
MPSSQFVYVLASSDQDYFAEMAAVSVATLHATTPDASVTILSDRETERRDTQAVRLLKDMATRWIVYPFDAHSPMQRSRQLKLGMRESIEGDFVFLDCDTLIARDISGLAGHRGDFAAVRDIGNPLPAILEMADRAGWALPRRCFNSGVLGVRDTPALRAAFADALNIWRQAAAEGVFYDQFAFWVAFERAKTAIEWLPATYNAQITMKSYAAIRPHIFHVFSLQFAERDSTVLHVLAKQLKHSGEINREILAAFVETGNPWMRLSRPGQYIALGRPVDAAAATLRLLFRAPG